MNTCTICGYKVIAKKVFEKHMESHSQAPEEVKSKEVETPAPEAQPVVEVLKVAPETPVENVVVLKFDRKIELWTNGIPIFTDENNEIRVTGPNCFEVAADLSRRAREAYGRSVLL